MKIHSNENLGQGLKVRNDDKMENHTESPKDLRILGHTKASLSKLLENYEKEYL